jgi:hypothetical protein
MAPALDARRRRRVEPLGFVANAGAYSLGASRSNRLQLGLMATWEITITCRDGARLRLSDRIDHAPLKGEIFDTADIGQTIKARIDAYRQERPGASRPPFYQVTATEI